jgi:tetratricopeptide (TPR) repeat protein
MLALCASAWLAQSDTDAELAQRLKLDIWRRGVQECGAEGCSDDSTADLTMLRLRWMASRGTPYVALRGGADGCAGTACEPDSVNLDALRAELGPEFSAALEKNVQDHEEDCATSCEHFYCGQQGGGGAAPAVATRSYSMGSVPPEDFAASFNFPLDLIRVTSDPVIDASEAERVVATAIEEGIHTNEYTSGKYKLGGDWVKKMPRSLAWFNHRLEHTIFPTIAGLFPEIVSDASVLRAHSVAILKYNASHPRTDVHVDDGILAMTLALSPRANYTGGGTFFEHMGPDNLVEMEQGQCTFRPGSVRHGGAQVTAGDRYILGGFLLIADRVEHVRRLNNQGRAYRSQGDLRMARLCFKWALRINPKCATCLKNWAEAIFGPAMGEGDGSVPPKMANAAIDKLERALELLPEDSDAWYSLGVILSDQGRKEEAIAAYTKSVSINADDHELCYNLAVLLGDRGDAEQEIVMLNKALAAKPDFGRAWANLGVAHASGGDLDAAEEPFRNAAMYEPSAKNWINLAKLHHAKGRTELAQEAAGKARALGGL